VACLHLLIVENIWALIIFIAFVLAVLITVFIKQESRIEELEKKMEELLSNKQD
jgi:cell division protein FtsB